MMLYSTHTWDLVNIHVIFIIIKRFYSEPPTMHMYFLIAYNNKLQSWTEYIGTQRKFTNFTISTPSPLISMLKSEKFWKKSLSKPRLSSGRKGGSVGEEIYEISVFVPFILSEIVWKFGSVDFVDFCFDFCILCLHEAVLAFKGKYESTMLWKCVKYLLTQHSHIKRGLGPTQQTSQYTT